ncbi:HEPN/Toprim-associated domain-containing protein [Massilia sp. Leaf139]|uniref:HEPN/Toprim-associated domain-containing protein n=1 Tax=Massilia sp. Leaf139 TaxID=1736272 RepID=UPI00190FE893|nr:HEPN/Toprim-associated domain-containing protein [Massilia sp. Leaf139]
MDLKVGTVALDWSRNGRGYDHGVLFQGGDRTRLRPDQISYNDYEGNDTKIDQRAKALVRSLRSTVPRLELLGYTVDTVRRQYDDCADEWFKWKMEQFEWLTKQIIRDNAPSLLPRRPLQFFEFIEFLTRHPILALDNTFVPPRVDDEEQLSRRFQLDPAFDRIPSSDDRLAHSEASYFSALVRILHPYAVLRMLALVESNLAADIIWNYGPMIENGWADESDFEPGARREHTFLIATEGSSDVHILNHALSLLTPEVHDFFRFIDVSQRHPFSGTGSLVKFAEGLVKIDLQNKLLVLFDNDAEGWGAFGEVQRYKLPPNMRAMVLPELDEFREFPALGPQGIMDGDINRRAAAIECYLDLRLKGKPDARVIWTNYKKEREVYQGSLEYKDTYTQEFLGQTQQTLLKGNYDATKLHVVLNHIFRECQLIAETTAPIEQYWH